MERSLGFAALALCLLIPLNSADGFLDDMSASDVSAVKLRLEEEKEKRLLLQNDVDALMLKVGQLTRLTDRLSAEWTLPLWQSWGSWSDCVWNCSGNNGGRIQTRTRTRCSEDDTCNKNMECSESESRSCNAVQFEGCKVSGEGDELSGLSYNYHDEMAQSICTAVYGKAGHVYAVRRKCHRGADSCATVCSALTFQCFNSIHVYKSVPVLQHESTGQIGLKTYIYHSGCDATYCGPNFCCCHE